MNQIFIKSAEKNYDVNILEKSNLNEEIDSISKIYRKIVILIDKNVKDLYPNIIEYNKFDYLTLEATEDQKSFHNLYDVFDFYQKVGLQKKDVILSIGGGIIQDIVSLTSKVYWRGIDHYLIPTTLLSMADSSIGAKCGINYNDKKNQIAVFNSPSGVILNLSFLNTLKDKDIFSGVGEIVKLLIIGGENDFCFLEKNINAAIKNRLKFKELIVKSLLSKKVIIEKDEYESDFRRILNYGHTLGHAIESLSNYTIPHGVAILWGMDIINHIAVQRGYMPIELYIRINQLILRIYDISHIKIRDYKKFIFFVKSDKKVEGNKVNIVYPKSLGNFNIKPLKIDEYFLSNIRKYYEG